MASFTMTKDQLATATLDAIKARAIELESPLSDEDAAALGAMMMASAEVGKVTEKKFNSTMEQLKAIPKEQINGMLMMAKMMSGGGVDPPVAAAAVVEEGEAKTEAPASTASTKDVSFIVLLV